MAVYVALLRAINVGGTGKLAMSELRALCEALGFEDVTTYIQSGNVVLSTKLGKAATQKKLEVALADKLGKPVGVHLRTPEELEDILARVPFADAAPNRVLVFFLERPVAKGVLDALVIPGREVVHASGCELFVHYPDGQGRSKLKVPAWDSGTGRNLNTVRKLLALANHR